MLSEHYGVFCAVIASSLLSNNNTNESYCAIRASYRSLASEKSSSFSRFQLLQLWRKAITPLQSHLYHIYLALLQLKQLKTLTMALFQG